MKEKIFKICIIEAIIYSILIILPEITNTAFSSYLDDNKDVNEILKTYFVKTFKKKMKEVLPQHFEELKKQKKAEKEKEAEAKGKKGKK